MRRMGRLMEDYKRTTRKYFVMYINQTITAEKKKKSETLKH